MTVEDEAFNEIERRAKQRKESVIAAVHTLTEYQRGYENGFADGVQKQLPKVVELEMYDSGWNFALEMAAHQVEHNFKRAFGADTLSSMAIYIRSLKK